MKLRYYMLLMRPWNLLIVILTQLIFVIHGSGFHWGNIVFPQIVWMSLAAVLSAAAGYVINDIFDIAEDEINKPQLRIVARQISLKKSRIFYAILLILSIVFGFFCSYSIGFLCISIGIMLYYYSSDLKGTNLWGNLLVSFLTAAVVFTSAKGVTHHFDGYFAEYALLAFLISMPREIVKDIEDIKGDKIQGYETFPIVHGIRKSVWLCLSFFILIDMELVYIMVRHGNLFYNIYCPVFVFVPLILISWHLLGSDEKKQFSIASKYLKILMVLGLGSVFFL